MFGWWGGGSYDYDEKNVTSRSVWPIAYSYRKNTTCVMCGCGEIVLSEIVHKFYP